jgi:predicted metal-dependent hydrolase
MAKLYLVEVDGQKIPFKIIEERRNGARVSLGAKSVILRIPKSMFFGSDVNKHVDWAVNWIKSLKVSKPNALNKYTQSKRYENGSLLAIGGHQFVLAIERYNGGNGHIKLRVDNELHIRIPNRDDYDDQKLIKKLMIKFCQGFFQKDIEARVDHFNDLYFHKDINQIRLKYNSSNWGSCSTGKNLNFSVRLFFAPSDVIDYVVVHELAHLIEMNHGPKFWSIVEKVMPDYRKKEKILSEYNSVFDF